MSKEAENYLKRTNSQNPYGIHNGERKPFSQVLQAYADEQVKPYIDLFNWIVECGENLSTIDKQVQFKRKLKQLEK